MFQTKWYLKLITSVTIAVSMLDANAMTYHVSPTGKDSNQGTEISPFATLHRAQKALRKLPEESEKQVVLHEGHYFLSNPLTLSKKDSGSSNSPVIYKAAKNEKVYISGGINLSPESVQKITDYEVLNRFVPEARDKIYVIDLKPLNIPAYGEFGPRGFSRPYIPAANELFINSKAQSVAQWPNPGEKPIRMGKVHDAGSVPRQGDYSNRGGVFEWNNDRPLRWTKAENVYLTGFFNWGYADDTVKVDRINYADKTFKTVHPHVYGYRNSCPWNTWTAMNLLEEIDLPGEYYLDKKNHKLYFYPSVPANEIKSICLSIQDKPLVSLRNASYIHFENITFENSQGMGIYIEGGKKCLIKDSTFRNLGMVAVNIGKGTKPGKILKHETQDPLVSGEVGTLYNTMYNNMTLNREGGHGHGVVNCKIYDTGAGGIILGGGDRLSLKAAGNYVRNCEIFRFNRLDRSYKSAINIDGVGNKIQHCLIYDAPGSAILLHGNNHLIEYNEIHHVMMDGDDMGAYYLGRDPSEFNNVVRYNYFHDIGFSPTTHTTWTMYYDDGACGNVAYGNVFHKAGKGGTFLIGGGSYNKIYNNIFIDCHVAITVSNRFAGWAKNMIAEDGVIDTRLKDVNYTQPPYSTAYPELVNYWKDNPAEPKNLIEKNVFYNCAQDLKYKNLVDAQRPLGDVTWRDNWNTKDDPGFESLETGDFTLKKDAAVYEKIKGFKPVPFNKMGILPLDRMVEITPVW